MSQPSRNLKLYLISSIAILLFVVAVFGYIVFNDKETIAPNQANEAGALVADLSQLDLPAEINLGNDEAVPLIWTDNNDNENLIIKSDRQYYDGNGQAEVYFSVTNASAAEQNTDIYFWFDNQDKQVVSAEKIGSPNAKLEIIDVGENNSSQPPLNLRGGEGALNPQGLKLKDINGYTDGSKFTDTIALGQTNYYKALVKYPAEQSQSEFFIEAFGRTPLEAGRPQTAVGSLTGYGHLDPYLTGGLVGYWTFNGANTDWSKNFTYDLSGSYATGTITNMSTTTSPVGGINGQALKFDGVDDYVSIPDSSSLDMGSNDFSISFWVKMFSLPSHNVDVGMVAKYLVGGQETQPKGFFFLG